MRRRERGDFVLSPANSFVIVRVLVALYLGLADCCEVLVQEFVVPVRASDDGIFPGSERRNGKTIEHANLQDEQCAEDWRAVVSLAVGADRNLDLYEKL